MVASVAAVVALAGGTVLAGNHQGHGGPGKGGPDKGGRQLVTELGALNDSGVSGTVEITRKGKMLTVEIEAEGLEANKLHPQHIHGFNDPVSDATCPEPSADKNGDGLIQVGEGLPDYGPVILPLKESFDDSFPQVGGEGELDYERQFKLSPEQLSNLEPLHKKVIVLHGMTVVGENDKAEYVASLPIACGPLENAHADDEDDDEEEEEEEEEEDEEEEDED
jgi:hypothetical protein